MKGRKSWHKFPFRQSHHRVLHLELHKFEHNFHVFEIFHCKSSSSKFGTYLAHSLALTSPIIGGWSSGAFFHDSNFVSSWTFVVLKFLLSSQTLQDKLKLSPGRAKTNLFAFISFFPEPFPSFPETDISINN